MSGQRSEAETGEMCSCLHVALKRGAAAFCTIWRWFMEDPLASTDGALKSSNLYFASCLKLEQTGLNDSPDLTGEFQLTVHLNPKLYEGLFGLPSQRAHICMAGPSGAAQNHHFCLLIT